MRRLRAVMVREHGGAMPQKTGEKHLYVLLPRKMQKRLPGRQRREMPRCRPRKGERDGETRLKHLGDITQIRGWEIEPVDVITGGSPCQDLSVAGARKGLKHEEKGDGETTRSGLFMEQVRIVKEMRDADIRAGRTGMLVRPRYMVWENVPGAFSSNKGADFQTVLTEIIRIAEPEAPDVEMPDNGKWPGSGCYYSEMGGWSVAYRTVDAQYWGTPQRRKRIALLADFNGLSAADILFDAQYGRDAEDGEPNEAFWGAGAERRRKVPSLTESVSGDFEQSGAAGEGTAEGTENSADDTICLQGNGIDRADTAGCNGAGWRRGGSYTLNTIDRPAVVSFQERAGKPGGGKGILIQGEHAGALSTINKQGVLTDEPILLESNQNHATVQKGGISTSLPAAMGEGGGYVSMVLNTRALAVDCRNGTENPNVNGTLQAKEQGQNLNSNNVVRVAVDVYNQSVAEQSDPAPTVTAAAGGTNTSGAKVMELSCGNPWDSQSERVYHGDGAWHSLNANESGGQSRDALAIPINTMVGTRDTPETRTTFGIGEVNDPQFTLSAAHEHAVFAFAQNQRDEVRDLRDVAGSLAAEPGMKQQTFAAGFSFGQGEKARSLGYQKEMSPTLRGGEGGNQKPVCLEVRTDNAERE